MPNYNTTHLLLGTSTDGVYADTGKPRMVDNLACSRKRTLGSFYRSVSYGPVEPTCPECSKYWAKLRLASLKEAGTTLTSEKVEAGKWSERYRSFELIRRNGEPIGYLTFPPGFGGSWQTFPLSVHSATAPFEFDGGSPTKYNSSAVSGRQKSRDAALVNAEHLFTEGKLATEAVLRQAAVAREASRNEVRWQREKREAEIVQKREQDRIEEIAEIDEILEGLRTALDRTDSNLSNYERDCIGRSVSRFMAQRDRLANGN